MTDTTAPRTAAPDLARLRELLAKATPGPWKVSGTSQRPHWYVSAPDVLVHGPAMERLDNTQGTLDRWTADARLIAESRNALPALLDTAEAIEPLLALVRAAAKSWPGQWFAEQSSYGEPFAAWVHNDSGTVIADVHTFEDAEFIAAAHNLLAALPESVRVAARKPK